MKDESSVLHCVTRVVETGKFTVSFSHTSDFTKVAQKPFTGVTQAFIQQINQLLPNSQTVSYSVSTVQHNYQHWCIQTLWIISNHPFLPNS